MNKTQLIAALAEKTGMNKKASEDVLEALKEIITKTLASGEKIQVVGFGSFEVKERQARVARNPRTNEEVKIEACKVPAFKPGKELKAAIGKEPKAADTKEAKAADGK